MQNSILFKDTKNFLCNEVNRVYIAIIIVGILLCYNCFRTEKLLNDIKIQNAQLQTEILASNNKIVDKVHFRYFNLTKSLEEIHQVKIDTKNGKLEK